VHEKFSDVDKNIRENEKAREIVIIMNRRNRIMV
jgi:hypothetical protein